MITELINEGQAELAETLEHVGVHTLADLAALNNGRSQLCYTIGLDTAELNLLQQLLESVNWPLDKWLEDWTAEQEQETHGWRRSIGANTKEHA